MTIQRIPTTNDPFYVQRTDLEGREFVFTFDFSTRESVWYLSIADSEEVEIVTGLKLVIGWPLLSRLATARKPPGLLFVISKVPEDDSPPGLEDLVEGGRCDLVYTTSDDEAL